VLFRSDFFAFHTPFAGMVKGAHRRLLRKAGGFAGEAIEADFGRRVRPSLEYAMRVGNLYSASLYLALASLVDHAELAAPARAGLYSYGSGCSSTFFSGVLGPASRAARPGGPLGPRLDGRYRLGWGEYEGLVEANRAVGFGVKDATIDPAGFAPMYERGFAGRGLLVLTSIRNYRREYAWS
jgi:polyketide biosynthesis 3-hydroxy-3-methylglutaryl-CoA synthase-like enzyme PksG